MLGSEDGLQRGAFTQKKKAEKKISEQKYHPKNKKIFLAQNPSKM